MTTEISVMYGSEKVKNDHNMLSYMSGLKRLFGMTSIFVFIFVMK